MKKRIALTLLMCLLTVCAVAFTASAGADEGVLVLKTENFPIFQVSGFKNTHVNTGNKAYDIVEVAKTQIGYKESPVNLTKYGEYFKENGTSWCAVFVVWCARQAGIPKDEITFTTWATADDLGVEYKGRDAKRTKKIKYTPLPGDIIVYDWGPDTDSYGYCLKKPASFYGDHVGIVEYVKDGYVHTIEGNYGDKVKRRSVPLSYSEIKGYGVPAYNKTHIPYIVETKITKKPTCTKDGTEEKLCFCGKKTATAVAKLGHSKYTVKENVIQSTCSSEGSYDSSVYCKRCKNRLSVVHKTTKKLAHTEAVEPGKEPSCTRRGWTDKTYCSVCATVILEKQEIPAFGHRDENIDGICDVCGKEICAHEGVEPVLMYNAPAACTQDGYTGDMVCPLCEDVLIEGYDIPGGHTFGEYVYDNNATCTSDGTLSAKCAVCGETDSVPAEGTMKAHTFGKWSTVKEATYISKGGKMRQCTVCGYKETAEIAEKKAADISKCTFSSIPDAVCTLKAIKPAVKVKNGKKLLEKDVHYTVSYSGNVNPGKASITVSGIKKNGYTGTKTITFKIVPGKVTKLKALPSETSITLSWNAVKGAKTYAVYKYSSSEKAYVKVKTVKTNEAVIKKLKSGAAYRFFVKAICGSLTGKRSDILKTAARPSAPNLSVKKSGSKAVLKWSASPGSTGYELYYKRAGGKYAKITDTNKRSYTTSNIAKDSVRYYRVRAYRTVDGKKIYSSYSSTKKFKR